MGLEVGKRVGLKEALYLSQDLSHYIGTYDYRIYNKSEGRWVQTNYAGPKRLPMGLKGKVIHREFVWFSLCYVTGLLFELSDDKRICLIVGPEADRPSQANDEESEAPVYGLNDSPDFNFARISEAVGSFFDTLIYPATPACDRLGEELDSL